MGNIQTIDNKNLTPISCFEQFMSARSEILIQLYSACCDFVEHENRLKSIDNLSFFYNLVVEEKKLDQEIAAGLQRLKAHYNANQKRLTRDFYKFGKVFGIDLKHLGVEGVKSFVIKNLDFFPESLLKKSIQDEMEINQKKDRLNEIRKIMSDIDKTYHMDELERTKTKIVSVINNIYPVCLNFFLNTITHDSYPTEHIPQEPKDYFTNYFAEKTTLNYDCFLDALRERFDYVGFHSCLLQKKFYLKNQVIDEYNKKNHERDELARQTIRAREKRNKLISHLLKKAEKYKKEYANLDDCLANCPAFADNKIKLANLNEAVFEAERKEQESQKDFQAIDEQLTAITIEYNELKQTVQINLDEHNYGLKVS